MAAKFQITILCVGKLREKYWLDAEAEYRKRLSAYTTRLTVMEVADEPTPDEASSAQEDAIRHKEAERLLAQIPQRDFVIALDSRGKAFDSPTFAAHLERLAAESSVSSLTFLIGGSLGFAPTIRERADLTLSFGAFTFPHQLMRILLLEQLYRAARINTNQPYHK